MVVAVAIVVAVSVAAVIVAIAAAAIIAIIAIAPDRHRNHHRGNCQPSSSPVVATIIVPVALLFIVRVSFLLVRLAVVVVVSLLLVRLGRRWGQWRFQHPRRGFAGVGRRSFVRGGDERQGRRPVAGCVVAAPRWDPPLGPS